MTDAITAGAAIAATPWAHRLGLHRPLLAPVAIALSALVLFHVVVACAQPDYWFRAAVWDEGYYVQIAREGYVLNGGDYARYSPLPFSPGLPLLLRAIAFVTGLDPLVVRLPVGALLFVGTCSALGWLLRAFSRDHVRNNLTILFLAFWPGSLYFCGSYAEALYMPLLLLCIGCMLRRRWFAAAWLAAACWFTRTPAVVVVGTLAAAIVLDACAERSRGALVRGAVRLGWAMPIAALGLLGYMAMTHAVTGDWFAFRRAYVAWEPCEVVTRRSMTFRTLTDALVRFPGRPTLRLAVAWFLAAPLLICARRHSMPAVLSVFAAGAWLFFLVNDWQTEPYHDTLRWLSVVFPLQWALVDLLLAQRPWLRWSLGAAWLLGSGTAFVWCVHLYVTKQWVS